jgi:MFS family permease
LGAKDACVTAQQQAGGSGPEERLLSREFLLLLSSVSAYGFAWSFYLILPKYFAQELGMDAAGIGRAVAVQGVTAVAMTPIVGWLVDRYGRKPWLGVGDLMIALTGIIYLFVHEEGPLLYLAQVVWGIGMVMGFNAAGAMTADIAPADRMAQAIGFFGAANLGMNAISPTIAELLSERVGWDYVFGLSACAGVVAALLSTRLTEPPKYQPRPDEIRKPVLGGSLIRVYAAIALMTACFTALFTLHQPFALEQGVTEVRRFFIGFAIFALVVRLGGGGLIDRFGVRRASVVSLALYSTVPPLLGIMGAHHLFSIGALMGVAHGVAYPALTALALERADSASRGMVVSILHGSFNGGHALFAYVLGEVAAARNYETTFWLAGILTLTGAFVIGVRWRAKPRRA